MSRISSPCTLSAGSTSGSTPRVVSPAERAEATGSEWTGTGKERMLATARPGGRWPRSIRLRIAIVCTCPGSIESYSQPLRSASSSSESGGSGVGCPGVVAPA
eukprot:602241-Rhodomonas_salina.1